MPHFKRSRNKFNWFRFSVNSKNSNETSTNQSILWWNIFRCNSFFWMIFSCLFSIFFKETFISSRLCNIFSLAVISHRIFTFLLIFLSNLVKWMWFFHHSLLMSASSSRMSYFRLIYDMMAVPSVTQKNKCFSIIIQHIPTLLNNTMRHKYLLIYQLLMNTQLLKVINNLKSLFRRQLQRILLKQKFLFIQQKLIFSVIQHFHLLLFHAFLLLFPYQKYLITVWKNEEMKHRLKQKNKFTNA